MNKTINQIIRFLFAGGTAFLIDFGILWVLTDLVGINYLLSGCISFSISVIYNYIMSIHWVFEVKTKKSRWIELIVFVLLSLIGLGINQLIMWLLVEKLIINYLLSKIAATIVVMLFNFITRKKFLEGN